MSTGSFSIGIPERIVDDTKTMTPSPSARSQAPRPAAPAHPAVAAPRQSGLHSGAIGWVSVPSSPLLRATQESVIPTAIADMQPDTRYECDRNGRKPVNAALQTSRFTNARRCPRAPSRRDRASPVSAGVETRLRQRSAAFARQHGVEPLAQAMQMQHVGGGIASCASLRLETPSRSTAAASTDRC